MLQKLRKNIFSIDLTYVVIILRILDAWVVVISDFSSYGSGRLLEDDFQELYLRTIIGDTRKILSKQVAPKRHLQLRNPFIEAVWRDIRNHGILSPVEKERKLLADEIHAKHGYNVGQTTTVGEDLMDECEILDWDYRPDTSTGKAKSHSSSRRNASGSKSSHKNMEMAPDNKTPLWIKDGEFGTFLLMPAPLVVLLF